MSNVAVGVNNIDCAVCETRGIVVTDTPDVLTDITADLVFALMLATARRVPEMERLLRAGEWQGAQFMAWLGTDVHHAALGILGMGRIGRAVARRASGFDMRVVYHDPVRQPGEVESALNAAYVSSDELLRTSDFVVLQMPYVRETHHMIGAAQLAMMKRTSILINAGRGGLVDDAALAEALAQGRLRAAGLDTFEGEPAVHPGLLGLRNVVLTPHVGSATEGTRRSMAMTAARNAVAALTGRAPPHRVPPAPMT